MPQAERAAAVQPGALSDEALAARVLAGDVAAFELIMRRHNRRLYRIARAILRNDADAEDAVQEAYLRAFAKLADFRGPAGFAAWLGRIAANCALSRVRARAKVVSLDDYMAGSPGPARGDVLPKSLASRHPDPERLASCSDLRRLIERALDDLPDGFRAVFVLRAVEGLSVAETAGHLGLREETVRSRFARARGRMRSALGNSLDALLPQAFPFAGERCDRIVAAVLARIPASRPGGT